MDSVSSFFFILFSLLGLVPVLLADNNISRQCGAEPQLLFPPDIIQARNEFSPPHNTSICRAFRRWRGAETFEGSVPSRHVYYIIYRYIRYIRVTAGMFQELWLQDDYSIPPGLHGVADEAVEHYPTDISRFACHCISGNAGFCRLRYQKC